MIHFHYLEVVARASRELLDIPALLSMNLNGAQTTQKPAERVHKFHFNQYFSLSLVRRMGSV